MLKRQNRLPRGVGLRGSKTFPAAFFILKVKENGFALNRFGIVVSKKIDKRAVERNRIKRILREILVNLNSEIAPGHDMLLIVKKGFPDRDKDHVGFLIKKVLGEGKYIK